MLIAFLAFGASASSIVAWRFAASRLWIDEQWFLYPPQCWWCFSSLSGSCLLWSTCSTVIQTIQPQKHAFWPSESRWTICVFFCLKSSLRLCRNAFERTRLVFGHVCCAWTLLWISKLQLLLYTTPQRCHPIARRGSMFPDLLGPSWPNWYGSFNRLFLI